MSRSVVAVVHTRPATVLEDTLRVFELGGGAAALNRTAGTILKDNISWHYPFPSANTTPWQLEGTILALRQHGHDVLHWRLQERRVYQRWLRESGWGQLFQRYLNRGEG